VTATGRWTERGTMVPLPVSGEIDTDPSQLMT